MIGRSGFHQKCQPPIFWRSRQPPPEASQHRNTAGDAGKPGLLDLAKLGLTADLGENFVVGWGIAASIDYTGVTTGRKQLVPNFDHS